MLTMKMFVCLMSLSFPDFPEVCAIQTVERIHETSDVDYCLAVQASIDSNPAAKAEWGAEIAFCGVFDPDRDLDRLHASDERMHGDVTGAEFDCLTDESVRC